MEIKQLVFFKLTAEMEHMTKAAEQLMVAQPFLSKTISSLEEELGVKLFDHVGRHILLNEYGRAFYKRVERIFLEIDSAKRELKDMLNTCEKTVTLVTNTSLYMVSLLASFRQFMPDIKIRQSSARRLRIISMLKSGEVEFAICTPIIDDDPDLISITLIEDDCPIIYPPNHWLTNKNQIDLKDLVNESFISSAPGYGIRDLAETFFKAAEISPEIIVESTDTSALPSYVKSGLGIAFSPNSTVVLDPILKENHINISNPSCIGVVGLTWRKDRFQDETSKLFKKFTIEHFKKLTP